MDLKSEKSIREYVQSLSDDDLIKYYLDVEFSPFPILIMEEYTRRFKQKTKSEIIKNIKNQEKLIEKKIKHLKRLGKKQKLFDEVALEKSHEFINEAKKKGHNVSDSIVKRGTLLSTKIRSGALEGVKMGMNARKASAEDNIRLLEKLSDLKEAGIISEREFKEKKKKILEKI